jgi:hypothetical protein
MDLFFKKNNRGGTRTGRETSARLTNRYRTAGGYIKVSGSSRIQYAHEKVVSSWADYPLIVAQKETDKVDRRLATELSVAPPGGGVSLHG